MVEIPRDYNPEPEPGVQESTREALEAELQRLEATHRNRASGLKVKIDSLKLYIDDIEKIEARIIELDRLLGNPPRGTKYYKPRWPKTDKTT